MEFEHLFRMTDSTGIIQHSKFGVPDFYNGYTTDDNARALIIACWLYSQTNSKKYLELIYTYSSYMHYAMNNDGTFKNFMNYQRSFLDDKGSEDCFGRSFWCLGFMNFSKNCLPKNLNRLNSYMIRKSIDNVKSLKFIRSKAYALVGLTYIKDYLSDNVNNLIISISNDIVDTFNKNKLDDWCWFEDTITYASGIIPYSLLRSYDVTKDVTYLNLGIEILDFLTSVVFRDGYIKLIGCKGWYKKGEKPAEYDEQAIDALDMVLAYSKAFRLTNNENYFSNAIKSYDWFLGKNIIGQPMVDTETDGCFDGITNTGINRNQGAESQFAYIMSTLTIGAIMK